MSRAPAPSPAPRSQPSLLRLLGLALAVGWLVVVGAGYTALFLFPAPSGATFRSPAPPDLSPASLPLLAAILILGIIRRLTREVEGSRRG